MRTISTDQVRQTVRDLYKASCVVINPELKAAIVKAAAE